MQEQNVQQIQRIVDLFQFHSPDIFEFVTYSILLGAGIMTISIFVSFGIFKAYQTFRGLSEF